MGQMRDAFWMDSASTLSKRTRMATSHEMPAMLIHIISESFIHHPCTDRATVSRERRLPYREEVQANRRSSAAADG